MSSLIFWLFFALKSSIRRWKKTAITLTGITLAIAVLILLGSIMNGVNDTIIENTLAFRPGHIIFEGVSDSPSIAHERCRELEERISAFAKEKNTGIESVSSRISAAETISAGSMRNAGTILTGINTDNEKHLKGVLNSIISGSAPDNEGEILIGEAAAESLGSGINEIISVISSDSIRTAEISGIFKTGIDSLDRKMSFIRIEDASFYFTGKVQYEVMIILKRGIHLQPLADEIREKIRTVSSEKIITWEERIAEIKQLSDLNRFSMYIMIALVTGILAFGISNTLLISVMDRYRSFAVLKAVGVQPSGIAAAVFGEAFFMCFFSGILGTILGIVSVLITAEYGIDISRYTSSNPNFTMSSVIFPRLTLGMTMLPQLLALLAGLVSSLWPAYTAVKRNPATGMRDI